jgi:hypothetical protein
MPPSRSLFIAAALGLIAALVSLDSGAVLYKWTDENGRTVYGDQPPPGAKPERLNASVAPADPNAVREMANKDAEIKKRQQQRVDDATKVEKEQQDAKKKLDQCVQARGRIKTLREDVAVYRYNEKGEKTFYQPADREKAINENQKTLRDLNCPPLPAT